MEAAYRLFNSSALPDLDVRAAQFYLTLRGFSPKGIDGILGSDTVAALRAFQASVGLPETGQPDPQTMGALAPQQASGTN